MTEYKFIVNTENVNSYGYRILTEGIDITQYERNPVVLFMHDRGEWKQNGATGDEVIGKARLVKENNMLLAYITFDSKNEFSAKIEGKVEGGFIKMCSMYAEPIECSLDPEYTLPGQKYETVLKCKLIEISIVDIGGNDDALRLSAGNSPHKLKLLNQNQNTMSDLKVIALALGKDPNSNESTVLEGVTSLKLSLETEKANAAEWKNKYIELQKKEATALVDKAVKLGLFPEDLKDGQISLFENDFDGQHSKLSKLIENKEAETQKNGKKATVEAVIQLNKKNDESEEEESFDYLQKHNPEKLKLMRESEPEKYRKLSLDYGNGVRYKPNN